MRRRFAIRYSPLGIADLQKLRASERVRVMDAAEEELSHRPNFAEGRKKLLSLKDGSTIWQLREGDFRLLYDVEADSATVTVRRVRRRGRLTTEEMLQ